MKSLLIALCITAALLALAPQESQAGLLSRLFGGRRASACVGGSCGKVAAVTPKAGPVYRKECSGNSCRMVLVK